MKKRVAPWMACFLAVVIALAGAACKKGPDKAGTAKAPPGHEKMMQQHTKEIEESKKVIVARVNGVNITMNDFLNTMAQVTLQYSSRGQQMTPEARQKAEKEVLDMLIFRELAVQEAVNAGMKASPEAVIQAVAALRTNAGSDEAFKKSLAMSGDTEESLRRSIERNMLFDMIAAREIFGKIKVDEKRLREAYAKNKNKYNRPEAFDVSDLVIIMKQSDDAAATKKANEVLALIKKNKNDFSKLTPDGTFILRQGVITREVYPELFKVAAKLKVGEVSDVIKENDELHIIKMTKREPAKQLSFDEARALIESELKRPLIERRKQEWEAELRKSAKIEIVPLKDAKKPTLAH
ncbi:MAG: peptidylprolyl isomerase [Nitrospirae bacterium]|nr:peptidylprolyl isomerase [Nitrospirota bacterium]